MKIGVRTMLEQPIKQEEKLNILCLDKYDNYVVSGCTNEKDNICGDICDIVQLLTEKLKSLGHDGIMQIQMTKYVWYEDSEEDFETLFK